MGRCCLPDEVTYDAPRPISVGPATQMSDFCAIRCRTVRRLLQQIDEETATGSDHVPAIVLKRCADVLALPITLLILFFSTKIPHRKSTTKQVRGSRLVGSTAVGPVGVAPPTAAPPAE